MSENTPVTNPYLRLAPIDPPREATAAPDRRRRTAASPLSPREAHFVSHYMAGVEHAEAMRLAGYIRPQRSDAEAMLQLPHVRAEIERQSDALAQTAQVTQHRVIAEHATMAFSDVTEIMQYIDPELTVAEMLEAAPRSVTAAIKKLKVTRRYEGRGDDAKPVDTIEIDMHDKHKSLDALAKISDLYRTPEADEVVSTFGEMLRAAVRARGIDDRAGKT